MCLMRRSVILALTLAFSFTVAAQETQTPPPLTPDAIWNALVQGNKLFAAGKLSFDTLKEERIDLKDHQIPPVSVLSCSDSRVPPELLFNQSLGAIFSVRSAGNIVDDFGIASMEFALVNGWTKLIVVLGHENCGVVKASLGGADPNTPDLTALARRIRMSFVGIPYDSRDAANLKKASEMNARASAAQLLAASKLIRDAVLTERVKLITAYYEFTTGEVTPLP